MGNFRFYRRVHLFPGLAVNLSRSGPSLSLGVRGAHVTFGHGRVTRTVGIPGSGLYWTSHTGRSTGFHSAHVEEPVSPQVQTKAHAGAFFSVMLLFVALGTAFALFGAVRVLLGLVAAFFLLGAVVAHWPRRG